MATERIDGIKYNLEREPDEVLIGIRGYLLERHRNLVDDIERISGELAVRGVAPQVDYVPEESPYQQGDLFRVDL